MLALRGLIKEKKDDDIDGKNGELVRKFACRWRGVERRKGKMTEQQSRN